MKEIEKIKKDGSIKELKSNVESQIHTLQHRNFEGILSGTHYDRLGEACEDAKIIIHKIEQRLHALNELDGKSQ